MIAGEHGFLRSTEIEDAPALHQLYALGRPRAGLLDNRREPLFPTLDELREMLTRKEAQRDTIFTLEDTAGLIRGFASLRGANREAAFGELGLFFLEEGEILSPLAEESYAFLYKRATERLRLHKLLVHCLDRETPLRRFWTAHGFVSEGIQREVLYAAGRWHHLETLACFAGAADVVAPECNR